jgi:hypothetical protein
VEENLYVFRIHGRYKLNEKIDFGAGFSYFSVSSQIPEIPVNLKIPEYRVQQDISWKQLFTKFSLQHRFQIEERFFQNSNEIIPTSGTTFFWRFRYRLQGECTVWAIENQSLKAVVYDELMINGGENILNNTFDQNRIFLALRYSASKDISFELGYLNSFQQRATGVDYFDRDIIRFTLYHKINLSKQ